MLEVIRQCLAMKKESVKKIRRYLTFIELLLVMALIAMIAGVAGVNIRRMILEQRFLSDVERIVDQLRLAQNLSLIVGHDTSVSFTSDADGKGVESKIAIEKLLPKASGDWQREIEKSRMPLKGVKRLDFQGQTIVNDRKGKLSLFFRSQGSVVPQGVVRLSSTTQEGEESQFVRYICFPGYSSPIFASSSLEKGTCNPIQEHDQNEQLTFALQREIAERNIKEALERKNVPIQLQKK